MQRNPPRTVSGALQFAMKWLFAILGAAGWIALIIQVVKPANSAIAAIEIIVPPVILFLAFFNVSILRVNSRLSRDLQESEKTRGEQISSLAMGENRAQELTRTLQERTSQTEGLSMQLLEARHFLSVLEGRLRSLGGGVRQRLVSVKASLDLDGTWHTDSHIEIEVTQGTLGTWNHYNSIALSRGLFFKDYTFSFQKVHCEPDTRIRCDVIKRPSDDSPNYIDINLTFSPLLAEGGTAIYQYCQSYRGVRAMTKEQADRAKLVRTNFRNEAVEVDGYRILCETEQIHRQVALPRGYDISSPGIAVLYLGNRMAEEEDRVRPFLQPRIIDEQWVLEWEVLEPKLWHSYYFVWTPPPEREYLQLVAETGGA